jgi:general secretion pathway protein G
MKKNQMNFRGIAEKGFTLVELLIVVIILAILAAIVVPQFASTTDDARDSAADSTLAGMRAAIDLYYQQHTNSSTGRNSYPGALTAVPVAACGGTAGNGAATGGAGTTAADAFMEQLSLYTDVNGGTCSQGDDIVYRFGPYLKKPDVPSEPYTGVSLLTVVAAGDLLMPATAAPGPGGYLFDSDTGKIIINLRAEETR